SPAPPFILLDRPRAPLARGHPSSIARGHPPRPVVAPPRPVAVSAAFRLPHQRLDLHPPRHRRLRTRPRRRHRSRGLRTPPPLPPHTASRPSPAGATFSRVAAPTARARRNAFPPAPCGPSSCATPTAHPSPPPATSSGPSRPFAPGATAMQLSPRSSTLISATP